MGGLCILCVVCVREGVGEEKGERERGREGTLYMCVAR